MKKPYQIVCVFLILTIGFAFWHQNRRVRLGELLIVSPTQGVFVGCRVFVDKIDKTISSNSKGLLGSIVLWEDADNRVFSRRCALGGRMYVNFNLPATDGEIAFYRNYFP